MWSNISLTRSPGLRLPAGWPCLFRACRHQRSCRSSSPSPSGSCKWAKFQYHNSSPHEFHVFWKPCRPTMHYHSIILHHDPGTRKYIYIYMAIMLLVCHTFHEVIGTKNVDLHVQDLSTQFAPMPVRDVNIIYIYIHYNYVFIDC